MDRHDPADGWKVYGPGGMFFCPACERPLGSVGMHHRFYIRVNPRGSEANPAPGVASSERCKYKDCRKNLERDPISAMAVA